MPNSGARRLRLGARLVAGKLDALIVPFSPNVRYLTGFTGSNGVLLVFADEAILFTDPRYRTQSAQEVNCKIKISTGPILPEVVSAIKRRKLRRIAFEKNRIGYEAYEFLKCNLPPKTDLKPVAGWVEEQRMIKSEEEIALVRASVNTNSAAFEEATAQVRPGMRESALAAELDYRMRRHGAEGPAFDTIVASGLRTALPHAHPTHRRMGNNGLVLIDMGGMQAGYASDMTRMLYLGKPDAKVRRTYKAVLEAQLAALAAVHPGATAERVDRAARDVLKGHGLDKAFVHSTGHGLGLEIHEPPRLGRKEKTRLQKGMTVTIEPGIYIEGFGGIRIEDTVVVTETGCQILTPTSKQLRVI